MVSCYYRHSSLSYKYLFYFDGKLHYLQICFTDVNSCRSIGNTRDTEEFLRVFEFLILKEG